MIVHRLRLALLFAACCLCVAGFAKDDSEQKRPPKASDSEITELEREAGKCRTARLALDRYEAFVACHDLTSKQRGSIDARMKVWSQRVDDGLYRVGNAWLTADAAKEIGNAADLLILESLEKITIGEFKRAKELLEKAARIDPSGTRADFTLGMLNTPNLWNYAPAAEKHFEHAYRRDQENPAIQNNLAISRIKMGKYSEAVDLWAAALRPGNEVPEVVHNLARFAQEVGAKRIPATEAHRKRAIKLYEKALADKKGPPASETTGWLYARLTLPADERERSNLPGAESSTAESTDGKPTTVALIETGTGTGFVIAPGIVLTNRHVAEGGTSFKINDPQVPDAAHRARVLAVCPTMDLAILRCEALKSPPIALKPIAIQRGSDVMVLGFPMTEYVGKSLKAVRGTIYGFEDDQRRDKVLYEATTNPGNSGGPVCDDTGGVIAVHFAGIKLDSITSHSSGKFGIGVPVDKALPFIQETVPNLQPGGNDRKIDWPAVDQQVSQSTVLIRIFDRSVPFVANPPTNKAKNLYEDRTCVFCKGRTRIPCPVKGCYRGSVSDFENSFSVMEQGYGQTVTRFQIPKLATCPGCRGAGIVDCPHCRDGIDPRLK